MEIIRNSLGIFKFVCHLFYLRNRIYNLKNSSMISQHFECVPQFSWGYITLTSFYKKNQAVSRQFSRKTSDFTHKMKKLCGRSGKCYVGDETYHQDNMKENRMVCRHNLWIVQAKYFFFTFKKSFWYNYFGSLSRAGESTHLFGSHHQPPFCWQQPASLFFLFYIT